MSTPGDHRGVVARMLGGAATVAACVPMVAMLPGGAASAFTLVGLGAGSGAVAALSPTLSPVAEPLLLVATALVAVSHLRCSPLAVASATAGGGLLYLGMYAITEPDGRAAPALFYPGLALFIASYAIPILRRRLGRCRPLVTPAGPAACSPARSWPGAVVVGLAAVSAGSSTPDGQNHRTMDTPSRTDTPSRGEPSPGRSMPRMPSHP